MDLVDLVEVVDEPVVTSDGFTEGFESGQFPPMHWWMETNGHPWEQAYDLVDTDNGVAQFPNYWVDTQGAYDMLVTPAFNPTGHAAVTLCGALPVRRICRWVGSLGQARQC